MEAILENMLFQFSYLTWFGVTILYFLVLYFGLGTLFLRTCKFLTRNNLLQRIDPREAPSLQFRFEMGHSLKSIFIFGFSSLPIIYLIRTGIIELLPNTWINILWGLVLLTLWNEVHFYVVHRFMHLKPMMQHIHYIHHRSTVPTVYSVYSFHWLEAFLLSTVPLTIVPFIPFSIVAVFLYPTVSILLNFAGHCNYRFGDGKGDSWRLFGTAHHEHHSKGRKNYGFALNLLDKLFSKPTK